jgi:ATP-dependent DNA ligase
MIFPKLLSTSATGALRYWIIKVIKNKDDTATIIREYGQVNGKAQFAETLITEGKSKENAYEQALFNANSLWKEQIDKKGYYEQKEILISLKKKSNDQEEPISSNQINNNFKMLPMLAKQYEDQKNHVIFPCYVQPKLDGIRYTARKLKSKIEFRTRNDKIKPFFDHIRNDISKLNLPTDIILDGEFYSFNPNVPFKNLNGYCNMTKIDKYLSIPDELILSVHYYIFDCYFINNPSMTYDERYKYLEKLLDKSNNLTYLHLVKCEELKSHKEINEWHDKYVEEGYEGIMIRNKSGIYVLKNRSSDLLKLKNFYDEEYEIVSADAPSTGKDKGAIIFTLKTQEGNTFTCRPRGTIDDRIADYKDYLKHPNNYIGKLYTVRFQEKYTEGSSENIPRFPVGIAIRGDTQ